MTHKYNKKEEYVKVTKTDALQCYALNNTDLENIEYKIKNLYGERYCKLFKLEEIEICAINKYGSLEKCKEEVLKRQQKKYERELNIQNGQNERKYYLIKALKDANLNFNRNNLYIDKYLVEGEKSGYTLESIIKLLKEEKFLTSYTDFNKIMNINIKKNIYFNYEDIYIKTINEVMSRYVSINKNNKEAIVKIPISLEHYIFSNYDI
jgi:hypothetical protein